MRVAAIVVSIWAASRWLGFLFGLFRLRRFADRVVRREARRTVIGRGAWGVFFTVVAVYLWADFYDVQPSEALVGFMAAAIMCSLAVATIAWFMQPQERTPETLEVCRLRPLGRREAPQP